MLKNTFKCLLFISSYTPLFIILILKSFGNNKELTEHNRLCKDGIVYCTKGFLQTNYNDILYLIISSSIILVTVSISVIFLFLFIFKEAKIIAPMYINIESIENKNSEILSYIGTYLIPFIGIDLNSPLDFISTFFLFVIIGTLYIKSELILVNPLLSIFGYNIFSCKIPANSSDLSHNKIVITKRKSIDEGRILVTQLNNNIFLLK